MICYLYYIHKVPPSNTTERVVFIDFNDLDHCLDASMIVCGPFFTNFFLLVFMQYSAYGNRESTLI